MLNYEEISNQCVVNKTTLNSGCVECNKKAIEFYDSVESIALAMDIITSKKVDMFILSNCDSAEAYNDMMTDDRKLKNGQFKLIKATLKISML